MRQYNIYKGKHYSSGFHIMPLFFKKKLNFRAYFWENCIYQLTENYDQVNKLYGLSQGMHHNNSARFGWRCTDGKKIEILAYCYVNGERIIKPLLKIKPGEWAHCYLDVNEDNYKFKIIAQNGDAMVSTIAKTTDFLLGYKLFPYFGGKIPAPHDMRIDIKKL